MAWVRTSSSCWRPTRRVAVGITTNVAGDASNLVGGDRLGLALHQKRLEHLASRRRSACRRPPIATATMSRSLGLAEHAGSGVHRVAHQGVRASVCAAEEPGEHPAGLNSLADHERTVDAAIWSAACSSASVVSPGLTGAPAHSTNLRPSGAMSVWSTVTPNVSHVRRRRRPVRRAPRRRRSGRDDRVARRRRRPSRSRP